LKNQLHLGNLDSVRDWGFSGDYVEAMWLMLQQDQPDDYVIATGIPHTVRELCELAFSQLDLDYRDYIVIDQRFYRPTEVMPLIGDSSKARDKINWQPKHTLTEIVSMMVKADYKRLLKTGNEF
jgi:GDPmannose 4,6-dehydratase